MAVPSVRTASRRTLFKLGCVRAFEYAVVSGTVVPLSDGVLLCRPTLVSFRARPLCMDDALPPAIVG